MDEHTISPAGDPFHAAPHDQEPQCACLEGVVYIGRLVVADDGEEVEVTEAVPCRRCAGKDQLR